MVDLPLIDEDAGVFGNEVAIQRCVFCCAEKEEQIVSPSCIDRLRHILGDSYVFVLCWFCENTACHKHLIFTGMCGTFVYLKEINLTSEG